MPTTPYPLPREIRSTEPLAGDGTIGPFGPTAFKVFDTLDVRVFRKDLADAFFRDVTDDVEIFKTSGLSFDTVDVTFDTIVPSTSQYLILAARTAERSVAVLRANSIDGNQLEKELTKIAATLSELRRDFDRAWHADVDATGRMIDIIAEGRVPIADQSGNLVEGPDASEIEDAQGYATAAGFSAVNSAASALSSLAAYTNWLAAAPTGATVIYRGIPANGATSVALAQAVADGTQIYVDRNGVRQRAPFGSDPGDYSVAGATLTVSTAFDGTEELEVLRFGTFALPAAPGGYFATIAETIAGLRSDMFTTPQGVSAAIAAGQSASDPRLGTLFYQEDIVLLGTGQSNMAGSDDGGDTTPNANVLAWDHAAGEWVVATIGQAPFPSTGANNLLFHMGKTIQAATGRVVRLILVALGGQPIERWEEDDGDPAMWERILDEVPAALAAAGISYVDRVAWMQGDGNPTQGIFIYRNKFIKVMNQMRALSWWRKGHTYCLAGEHVDNPLNAARTHTLSLRLAAEIDKDVGIIPSFGVEAKAGEEIHYSGEGLVEFGGRFGRAALRPYAPVLDTAASRHCRGNTYFYLEQDGSGDFDDLGEAFDFFSTLTGNPGARVIVAIGEGKWTSPTGGLRLAFNRGDMFEFTGVLAGGFARPVKADFIGTKATDLAMLRAKYLTEIEFVSHGLVPASPNGGRWDNVLFTATAATLASAGVRSTETSLPKNVRGFSIQFVECAFHGWDASQGTAVWMSGVSSADCLGLVVSHCTQALLCSTGSVIVANDAVLAHCTIDGYAQQSGNINAYGSKTTNSASTGWQAHTNGYLDARTADNIGAVTEQTNGIVQVA